MRYYNSKRRDTPGDYFPLPKAIFRLGLGAGEIAVLAFLMYCEDRKTYEYGEYEKGKELLQGAADNGYTPAEKVLDALRNNLNARLIVGVCDLFYYIGNLIGEHTEEIYQKEQRINSHGIDRRQRKALRDKKQAIGLKEL